MIRISKASLLILPMAVASLIINGCSTTDPAEDSAPKIQSVYPANGAVDIAYDEVIVVTYTEPMDTASCEARFFAYEDNIGQMGHMMMHGQDMLSGEFQWNEEHTIMSFHPDSMLSESVTHTYHLEEGMNTHQSGSPMMMGGMEMFGQKVEDGIICTFTTTVLESTNSK